MRTALLALFLTSTAFASDGFALHSGDRVVFYGDSITDNAAYTRFAEIFTTTRYPKLDVSFFNAGVGGDRVSGGWMGPVDDRLPRDLFSRRPTVITVMLGMNDAAYRTFDQGIFDTYRNGYQHIADRINKEAPKARVWLFQPSPYDDVTRTPGWAEGYNSVLLKYADYVADLAKRNSYGIVDQNGPLVKLLEKAKASNAEKATKIIGDRVHPSEAGHYLMALQVLKAWGASSLVSKVEIEGATGTHHEVNATVSAVTSGNKLTWTTTENALPFPLAKNDSTVAFVLENSDLEQSLNQETLVVNKIKPGSYTLNIDGKTIGTFSDDQLATGINLALFDTPMLAQARAVESLVNLRTQVGFNTWRNFEYGTGAYASRAKSEAIGALWGFSDELKGKAHEAAKPVAHKYELIAQ